MRGIIERERGEHDALWQALCDRVYPIRDALGVGDARRMYHQDLSLLTEIDLELERLQGPLPRLPGSGLLRPHVAAGARGQDRGRAGAPCGGGLAATRPGGDAGAVTTRGGRRPTANGTPPPARSGGAAIAPAAWPRGGIHWARGDGRSSCAACWRSSIARPPSSLRTGNRNGIRTGGAHDDCPRGA